jgi:hypothetical protein
MVPSNIPMQRAAAAAVVDQGHAPRHRRLPLIGNVSCGGQT